MGLAVAADTFNPVIVDFYEQVGYLPDALLNYLLLLGWSLDDKTEEFTREEMLQHFSLERVNKAPASFDPEKLHGVPDAGDAASCRSSSRWPRWCRSCSGPGSSPIRRRATRRPYVTQILEAAGDRVKVAGDILDFDDFFVADDAACSTTRRRSTNGCANRPARVELLARVSRRAGHGRTVHGRAARTS